MQFTAKRSEILREAELALGAVKTKTTIPILGDFRFEAGNDGVTLTATDLELVVSGHFAAKVAVGGTGTVPARRFVEILKALPEGDVAVHVLENHWVEVKAGKSKFKLPGMDAANFPVIPAAPRDSVAIQAAALGEAIRKTTFAISRAESRYTLDGALMILSAGGLTLVATDGHRLALAGRQAVGGEQNAERTLVPKNALVALQGMVDKQKGESSVGFAQDEVHLFFSVPGRQLISRRLTGQFPNYDAVLPKENHIVATVDAATLAKSIARVGLMADERMRAVQLTVGNGNIEVSTTNWDDGEARDAVETDYAGEAVSVGFNYSYLLDFLGVVTGPVRLMLKDGQSAAELRPADDGYRYVLMPMRL